MLRDLRLSSVVAALGLALTCFVSSSAAQDKPKSSPSDLMEKEVGDWDAVIKFDQGGQVMEVTGVEHNALRGGIWLVSDFEADFGGQKFEGHGVRGADTTKKKIVSLWVDSMQPYFAEMEGEYDEDGTLTLTGEYPDPTGEVKKWKSVSKWVDDDNRTFTMMMGDDKGDYQEMMTIEYKRKKGEPAGDDKPADAKPAPGKGGK